MLKFGRYEFVPPFVAQGPYVVDSAGAEVAHAAQGDTPHTRNLMAHLAAVLTQAVGYHDQAQQEERAEGAKIRPLVPFFDDVTKVVAAKPGEWPFEKSIAGATMDLLETQGPPIWEKAVKLAALVVCHLAANGFDIGQPPVPLSGFVPRDPTPEDFERPREFVGFRALVAEVLEELLAKDAEAKQPGQATTTTDKGETATAKDPRLSFIMAAMKSPRKIRVVTEGGREYVGRVESIKGDTFYMLGYGPMVGIEWDSLREFGWDTTDPDDPLRLATLGFRAADLSGKNTPAPKKGLEWARYPVVVSEAMPGDRIVFGDGIRGLVVNITINPEKLAANVLTQLKGEEAQPRDYEATVEELAELEEFRRSKRDEKLHAEAWKQHQIGLRRRSPEERIKAAVEEFKILDQAAGMAAQASQFIGRMATITAKSDVSDMGRILSVERDQQGRPVVVWSACGSEGECGIPEHRRTLRLDCVKSIVPDGYVELRGSGGRYA